MRADELRIGNYLKKDVVVKIDAKIIFDIWIETEEYEPIPITEEWVFKFGFELFDYWPTFDEDNEAPEFFYMQYKLKISGKSFYYTIYSSNNEEWQIAIKMKYFEDEILLSNIKYVHELQNLYFALRGEELIYNELIID